MSDVDETTSREDSAALDSGLALASRGDALTPYLFEALQRRFSDLTFVDPELSRGQRLVIAGLTFRPTRRAWAERFYKSSTARDLRTRNAARSLRSAAAPPAAVLQVHSLFDVVGVPTVVYVDCTHRQSAEQWPDWNPLRGRALQKWYEREQRSYEAADHLFAFSMSARHSLITHYGIASERVSVVGGGANLCGLPAVGQRKLGPLTVLFVGNDFARKGGPVLLDAFRAVREQHQDARLILVGDAPKIAAERGVTVLGRLRDRRQIEQLYREATVFALPSYFDPFPLVLMEAMAFGVPVVATRQMGATEMVEDGVSGRLLEPGDVGQLTAALIEVLENPDRARRWGAAGRARVEQQFTWDAVVDRMAPVLQELTGTQR